MPTLPSDELSSEDESSSPPELEWSGDGQEWWWIVTTQVNRLQGFWGPAFGREDAEQVGRLAVVEALQNFDPRHPSGISLQRWVWDCVKRRLIDATRARYYREFDRRVISLEEPIDVGGDPVPLGETVEAGNRSDPWQELCRRDRQRTIWEEFVSGSLSPLEASVFTLWAEVGAGRPGTYPRIMEALGLTYKQVDNAMRRVKQKMRLCPALATMAEELSGSGYQSADSGG